MDLMPEALFAEDAESAPATHPPESPARVVTQSVQIEVPGGGVMRGYLARPAAAGAPRGPESVSAAPAVVVAMELFGVSAHARDVCERLARLGLVALAPDFYHRSAPGVELPEDEAGRARGYELLGQVTRTNAVADVSAAMGFLQAAGNTVVGMIGLSAGGHITYLAATELDLPAVVVLYGGWLTSTDIALSQPEATVTKTGGITGRVLMLVGGADPIIPSSQHREVEEALSAAGVAHELVEYPGAAHGFLSNRRASYDPVAAEDAWTRIEAFLAPSRRP